MAGQESIRESSNTESESWIPEIKQNVHHDERSWNCLLRPQTHTLWTAGWWLNISWKVCVSALCSCEHLYKITSQNASRFDLLIEVDTQGRLESLRHCYREFPPLLGLLLCYCVLLFVLWNTVFFFFLILWHTAESNLMHTTEVSRTRHAKKCHKYTDECELWPLENQQIEEETLP